MKRNMLEIVIPTTTKTANLGPNKSISFPPAIKPNIAPGTFITLKNEFIIAL